MCDIVWSAGRGNVYVRYDGTGMARKPRITLRYGTVNSVQRVRINDFGLTRKEEVYACEHIASGPVLEQNSANGDHNQTKYPTRTERDNKL